ncbi:thioredoxin-dependent thiol peroxidase [Thermoanaerobacterium thermosaccharolyticum]|jgi:peroxiredoxin Q/BCP|uniref:thioredoxin-dependent peroxiredoxin n=1 Tax=Thermoanaerobacterium thermosaccharolyticum (strain ATCC 7956 / DSM 571 / NCIMB 9385 / NCA 3814 / NCTC 13789 / WDCM 00135 / 2032) TaxID=580327 RepID=D9TPR8_THETC|nr:thioredoxin-dependent thiol peroxidase [Thermoanaerobacterium thermosaccharolyticum]ADL68750.1 Peroxiredoxin [Thermoanaerobacterium thermosaccharolyticum DSM 571]KAA5805660.1 thioredoxin-dependent thiol peroxidase [Thermoanaerobacterium thermosaccharolyticum]MBE0067880.1 thioredoxin-dependent thiol peroxidase [Thermoanaerobacterium thermosaccharolyticum]MBE0227443.1 thioredoxin-dependent thiol peroxidase [Thermoanaerobacterium thermosaccharolyticum]
MIELEKEAPDFTLKSSDGNDVSLSDFKGKKVVLYFYPKDNTPGCTKEACQFRDNINTVKNKDAVILGVSLDDIESHKKFIEKFNLPFILLSDSDAKVSTEYGVYKEKNMYGKKKMGIERSTFIIDQKGIVKKIFRKVKVDGHVDEILEVLDNID